MNQVREGEAPGRVWTKTGTGIWRQGSGFGSMMAIAWRLGRVAATLLALVAGDRFGLYHEPLHQSSIVRFIAYARASSCHSLVRRQGHPGFRARRTRSQSGFQADGVFITAEPCCRIGSGVALRGHCQWMKLLATVAGVSLLSRIVSFFFKEYFV